MSELIKPPMKQGEIWRFDTFKEAEQFLIGKYGKLPFEDSLIRWFYKHNGGEDWNIGHHIDKEGTWRLGFSDALLHTENYTIVFSSCVMKGEHMYDMLGTDNNLKLGIPLNTPTTKETKMNSLKKMGNELHESLKPHMPIITSIVALYVIDVFILKGKGQEVLKRLGSKLLNKIEKFLDKIIGE